MATTVQVEQETLEILRRFRESRKSRSYDEAVRKLLAEAGPKKSMWGILGKRSMKQIVEGLRDERDRL